MKVGITGANGFIGNHLTRYVASLGHEVIAFLLRDTSDTLLESYPHQVYWGDVIDSESLYPFLKSCDVLFHLSGFNRYWAKDPNIFNELNVISPNNIATACLSIGIKKIVHVSSCITLGVSEQPVTRNEKADFNMSGKRFLYAESKKAGEDQMKLSARENGLPVVIVNPASAIGEMDYGPTPIGAPIIDICKGWCPVWVDGGAYFIDVHDLVQGLWLAMEKGRTGQQYLLAGDNLSNRDFMIKIAKLAGKSPPKVRIPKSLLSIVAHSQEWLANHLTHKAPKLTVGMYELIEKYLYYDRAKAKDELGFNPVPCDTAVAAGQR
jgi:dihydroflavonol-4-reductase